MEAENVFNYIPKNFNTDQFGKDFSDFIIKYYDIEVSDQMKVNPMEIKMSEQKVHIDGKDIPTMFEVKGEVQITFKLRNK